MDDIEAIRNSAQHSKRENIKRLSHQRKVRHRRQYDGPPQAETKSAAVYAFCRRQSQLENDIDASKFYEYQADADNEREDRVRLKALRIDRRQNSK
jgi:hypothetical protein